MLIQKKANHIAIDNRNIADKAHNDERFGKSGQAKSRNIVPYKYIFIMIQQNMAQNHIPNIGKILQFY